MKIAIVDDQAVDLEQLNQYLQRYASEHSFFFGTDSFYSGEELLNQFLPDTYQIIFLDIFMKELDGMKTAQYLRQKDPDFLLIFITTSPDFAIEGYSVRASSYLLKPYSYANLEYAMDMCIPLVKGHNSFIEVKENRYYTKILLNDILYTDYHNHYIQIHTSKRLIRTYMPFASFAPMLLQYEQFLCCYRNIIINMDKVLSLDHLDFIMCNEDRVPLKRSDKRNLRQQYADYVFKKMNGGTVL